MISSFTKARIAIAATSVLLAASPALAASSTSAPSTNATANLIRLLINNKVITKAAGEALLAQAEAEAATALAAEAQAKLAAAPTATLAPPTAVASAELPAPAPGTIRVPYIPETLRAKIKDELKEEVLAQAKTEGWAKAGQVPDWLSRVTPYGDMRFRNESTFYSKANTNELIDFGAFNQLAPIDINAATNPTGFPLLNTRTDRPNTFRLRARLGLRAKLSDLATVSFRLATGDDISPISTNQVLGGGFAKKDIWLDQANIRLTPTNWLSASLGRFSSPFKPGQALFDTAELMFDNDLNFDGITAAADAKPWLPDNTRLALTLGAFPLEFTDQEFPINSVDKAGDGASKWLFSAQLKGGVTFGDGDYAINGTVAYHSFKGVQGQLSTPCDLFNGNTQCSTDQNQPAFLRKGNTLFFLRDINPDPASPNNFAQPQTLGLAFDYDVIQVSASVGAPIAKGVNLLLEGEYIRNLAFKQSDLCRFDPKGLPINNIIVADPVAGAAAGTAASRFYTNPCTPDANGRIARFDGGNQGYSIRGVIGIAEPKQLGDWNIELSYRYIESDATLDSLSDSDFHRGGTNAKGYTIGGTLGLGRNLFVTGRWLSANEISGPPLAIDVLQVDLVAKF
ncbi:putative porin [Sandarakinorhabdus sp.]|uniref:putative porin n=1 Tax=Sandarakinorhabdus sp. TaxID=1916663 RepID=UPI00286E8EE2|nr:putative porin [Sandarakinorhabdus sp.]